jgi:hypothetical protein
MLLAGTGLIMTSAEFQSGYLLMAYNAPMPSLWSFLQPMDTPVWLLMFLTPVITAMALMLLEHFPWSVVMPKGRVPAAADGHGHGSSSSVAAGLTKHLIAGPVVDNGDHGISYRGRFAEAAAGRHSSSSSVLWKR